MSGNIHDFMASTQIKRRIEVEANLNDSKRQRIEAPIPQNPEDDIQGNEKEEEVHRPATTNESLVLLGPSGTTVKNSDFEQIQWFSVALATRSLLTLLFDEETLATHTISRVPHIFQFHDRVVKPALDFEKVSDTIYCIQRRFGCSEIEVRELIITICSKMATMLQGRRL